jgi:O-antigen/teichoic acid export membrane protein
MTHTHTPQRAGGDLLERSRPRLSGTAAILLATAFNALAVYGYQVIAGRTLGTDDFAPVGVLWAVGFFTFTVLGTPVEQMITRRLVLFDGDAAALWPSRFVILGTYGVAVVLLIGFIAATLDRFFDDSWGFVLAGGLLAVNRSVANGGRGLLAGRRRFRGYAGAIAAQAAALVLLAAAAALIVPTSLGFAFALAFAPLAELAVRPFTGPYGEVVPADAESHSGAGFLGWFLVAAASSQLILAGGPIAVGLVGGSAASISVYFITFTLFRGPMTSSYNLLARVLPNFTDLAHRGDDRRLAGWATFLGGLGVVLAVVFAIGGALCGPAVVSFLFGAEFEPTRTVAALAAAGIGAGLAGLFITQVFVARGTTASLAAIWIGAVLLSTLTIVLMPGTAIVRVAWGFFLGEVAALLGLAIVGTVQHTPAVRS